MSASWSLTGGRRTSCGQPNLVAIDPYRKSASGHEVRNCYFSSVLSERAPPAMIEIGKLEARIVTSTGCAVTMDERITRISCVGSELRGLDDHDADASLA